MCLGCKKNYECWPQNNFESSLFLFQFVEVCVPVSVGSCFAAADTFVSVVEWMVVYAVGESLHSF